eukprot:TRINITY_DN22424_c0_g1_i1.p1 TRINITY_DN22424_c0_g1~~TRINITY_DN22424_c0_g1_i1.p1  ORF type:complete len:502 (+),score=84.31 TRINITY_DN22424_c0_g1_i1:82-1587(+)
MATLPAVRTWLLEHVAGICAQLTEAAGEQLSATVWVSVTAVASDVVYNFVARRLRRMAQVQRVIAGAGEVSACALSRTAVVVGEKHHVCRVAERQRLLKRLRDCRSRYTLLVADVGSGMSSLLRGLANENHCVKYLSLAGVSGLAGLTQVFRVEYGLRESERMPVSYLLFHKIIAGVVASGGEEDESFGDDLNAFRDACAVIESLTREAAQRCSTLPVLIVDHVDELDEEALQALQTWAAQAHRAPLHVAIATDSPHQFFGKTHSSNMTIIGVRSPPAKDIAQYMRSRCNFLTDEQCMVIVTQITGTYIGLAERACQCLLELRDDGRAGCARAALRRLEQHFLRILFAQTRSLHLYCLQPLGDADLDAERLGVFRICRHLIDLEATGGASGEQHGREDEAPSSRSFDAPLSPHPDAPLPEDLPLPASVTFDGLFALCPLPVYLRLLLKRSQLPLRTGFDTVSLRAPCYLMAMRWVLGTPGTAKREEADAMLERLKESVEES